MNLFLYISVMLYSVGANKNDLLVALPPFFYWNSYNNFVFTASSKSCDTVDMYVRVWFDDATVHRRNFTAHKSGLATQVTFYIGGDVQKSFEYTVTIMQGDGKEFETIVQGAPDVSKIHLQIDKNVYRESEIVQLRALPLTKSGIVSTAPIEFLLLNPKGFQLLRKVNASKLKAESFISLSFPLPEILEYGKWKIVAQAVESNVAYKTMIHFHVADYVMQPFNIRVIVKETENMNLYQINITARYSYGRFVRGRLIIHCECADNDSLISGRCTIAEVDATGGFWSQVIDVSRCLSVILDRKNLNIKVHDHGTGKSTTTSAAIDVGEAGFEIIPMRPGYTIDSTEIPLVIASHSRNIIEGNTHVVLEVYCVATDVDDVTQIFEAKLNQFISLPVNKEPCLVLIIKGRRKIGGEFSKNTTVVIPYFSKQSGMDFNLITLNSLPQNALYHVDDTFEAILNVKDPERVNYLVICQDKFIASTGRVQDDGTLSLKIRRSMKGRCVLFAYINEDELHLDMIAFAVTDKCPYSLELSANVIDVNENLTVTIYGERHGLATLHLSDERMVSEEEIHPHALISGKKLWDLFLYTRSDTLSDKINLRNFINFEDFSKSLNHSCTEAAVKLIKNHKLIKVMFMQTQSAISDKCLHAMKLASARAFKPTTSSVCDRQQGECRKLGLAANFQAEPPRIKLGGFDEYMIDNKHTESVIDDLRDSFPEIWFFDDFKLGSRGSKQIHLETPHAITNWIVSSSIWGPDYADICKVKSVSVIVKKRFFVDVDVPKYAYVNETVPLLVTATVDEEITETIRLSICVDKLERHTCIDMGIDGEESRDDFNTIYFEPNQQTASRFFNMRFYRAGEAELVIYFKVEGASLDVDHHCMTGKVLDAMKIKFNVIKRLENGQHFRRLILTPRKILGSSNLTGSDENISKNLANQSQEEIIIDYVQYHHPHLPRKLFTNVRISAPYPDRIQHITVELSKFLPDQSSAVSSVSLRQKREMISEQAFLTDHLKIFATVLYEMKALKLRQNIEAAVMEGYENKIASVTSAVLTFSDCARTGYCGFGQTPYRGETNAKSLFLSMMTVSLLCQSEASEQLVCPVLRYLMHNFGIHPSKLEDNLLIQLGLASKVDQKWFLRAMFHQVSSDCRIYSCISNDEIWIKLRRNFYNLSSDTALDIRTIAALACMAPINTRNVMRTRMYSMISASVPYWSFEHGGLNWEGTPFSHKHSSLVLSRSIKNGNILANSLGIMAFGSHGIDPITKKIELDSLADWLYEQLSGRISPVDTYFGHRAIYEYRLYKVNRIGNDSEEVMVECASCKNLRTNISASSSIIHLPNNTKNFTVITNWDAKIRAGVRVETSNKRRIRRNLNAMLDAVTISVVQQREVTGDLKQETCIWLESEMIDSLEIIHEFFSGFSPKDEYFRIINKTQDGVKLANSVWTSAYAMHFVLINLIQNSTFCYELLTKEPKLSYEPEQMAPITIAARSPIYEIVGRRMSTYLGVKKDPLPTDSIVDSVCWDGVCGCAERICSVNCYFCRKVSRNTLKAEICAAYSFAATVEIESIKNNNHPQSIKFYVMDVSVKHWKQYHDRSMIKPEIIEIWLAKCSKRCDPPKPADIYYIGGNIQDLKIDTQAGIHYILRDGDRWEKASGICAQLFSYMIVIDSCDSK